MDEPAERSNLPRHDIRFGRFYLIATESRIDAATRQSLSQERLPSRCPVDLFSEKWEAKNGRRYDGSSNRRDHVTIFARKMKSLFVCGIVNHLSRLSIG